MSPTVSDRQPKKPGQIKEITSLANPIIKDIKTLSQKKKRDETGTFMAEGLKLVIDALELGWTIHILVYALEARGKPLVEQVSKQALAQGALVLEVSDKVIASVTRRDNPQMVVGIFETRWRDLETITPQKDETYLALDRVRDPGNLGTIIRTADAAGVSGVILIGETTDPFSLETVRATMGSVFAMPVSRTTPEAFLRWQEKCGAKLVATHLEGSVDYRSIRYDDQPIVLLMGNEQQGLAPQLAEKADALARIPQVGRADSLNLAVATAVILFEARRHLLTLDKRA
ncbi:MAG: hypothetical protein RIR97_14 [Pseudomonadota bacterium]